MIEAQIKYIADGFIRALQSTQEVIEYLDTLSKYENDEEINSLTKKYYSLSSEFQKKQYNGTLTQDEISEIRTLANMIQNNSLNIELAEKQNSIKNILQGCNATISNEISMDFAKLSAQSTC
jgi:cell fate (sporulation/competence/biofilm development) regulator YlbF (YheA/YmcA/DUF963 family)